MKTLAAFCVLWCGSAAAQGALQVLPADTLFYPVETVVSIANSTAETVVFDSVAVRIGGPWAYYAELTLPDSTYATDHYLNPYYETGFSIGVDILPGDTAFITLLGFDPCIVCRSPDSPGLDSLLIYSGGNPTPAVVRIDLSNWVTQEPRPFPESSLAIVAYPNPSAQAVTVRVEGDSGDAEVMLVDALGRVVHRHAETMGPEPLILDTSSLPPGRYHIVAVTPDGQRAVTQISVLR